jgi:hypothetical protein
VGSASTSSSSTLNSLQCPAGRGPVIRRSGKRDLVVAHRLACSRNMADTVHERAFAGLRRSAAPREFYTPAPQQETPPSPRTRQPLLRGPPAMRHQPRPATSPSSSPTATGPSAVSRPRSLSLDPPSEFR